MMTENNVVQKAVLISVLPEWSRLILNGQKTVELRKNFPTLKTPFRCYIYESKGMKAKDGVGRCKVVGEFICDGMQRSDVPHPTYKNYDLAKRACILQNELYIPIMNGEKYCGWTISDVVSYNEPKDLSEFYMWNDYGYKRVVRQPPQSWCYVEAITSKETN